MKIYKFSFNAYGHDVYKSVLEVEEKPKTYIAVNDRWKTRINKSDIGRVGSFNDVYLLEDDKGKAIKLFCENLESDIRGHQEIIAGIKKEIEKWENAAKQLSEEGEHEI